MDEGHREELTHLRSLAEDNDFHVGDEPHFPDMVNMEDILTGAEEVDLSHAEGEMGSLEQDIEEGLLEDDNRGKRRSKREDWRTRRDRTEIRNHAFSSQMPEMVSAYICMCAEPEMPAHPRSEDDSAGEIYEIQVVDMFDTSSVDVQLDPLANGILPALILAQLMPYAPWTPTVAIKICVLEMYHVTHVRCPQLAIQSFVKSLCDLHGAPYRPYLCQQFSIAYDLYLDIRRPTDERVMHALGRDSTWRLKHACLACTYKLEGEEALIFEMLTTMDGNDSLKRSRERVDNRDAGDGYYILQDRVERWARDRVADRLPMQTASTDKDNSCTDRWKNMINDVTSKMWGIFDETGIFLALCRHGFVLVIADMIKSGELATYPLAVVRELLNMFGMKLGAGYDVGCHVETTVANSDMGEEVREKKLKCLVGSFHGHTHNRLCQLRFLATYVEGIGLEDLEGCEYFFSRSNGLARSCRYASRFHRQQEITTYAKHFDTFKTYANLSKFLCNNYTQALAILKMESALRAWMRQEGVDGVDRFHKWLAGEKMYLEGLKSAAKTDVETMEMEALDDGWLAVVVDIKKWKYTLALDALELLIVERIFELMKMNQSQTGGYKMHKHIAKALQAHSKVVRNAIDRYNDAAATLDPPMPCVTWDQVVEYAFLTGFDIL
ncbi:hypothetical protein K438DRAFT_1978815 [Mycena galopus ATCC 62051]|nr:hypothetical protein K438DRAFT_1978815 [Mycena galopus ATCC 62051]